MNNDNQLIGQPETEVQSSETDEVQAVSVGDETAVADEQAEVTVTPPAREEENTTSDEQVEADAAAPPAEEEENVTPTAEVDVEPAEEEVPQATEEAAEGDPTGEGEPTDEELFLAALNGDMPIGDDLEDFMFKPLERGQLVQGTIERITSTEILIDVGTKMEGIVSGREMERLDRETLEELEVGQEIYVYVLNPEDNQGYARLSLSRALEEQDWREAEQYLQEAAVYKGKINGFNKGGLIVRFGKVRGFVPASQVSLERRRRSDGSTPEERWGNMVGEDISAKVIEVDRGRNRLILSERAAAREQRASRRAELLENLEVGQVHTGHVTSLADFGAFVDLGGADGLIHLSELSWKHVTHPREVINIGDEVRVEIISIDRERQRIGLSCKRCQADPWDTIADQYEVKQLVQGTVTKLTKFGAFARLVDHPAIEGLIHISELSDQRIGHPREMVEEGDMLTLRIVRIDAARRRLGLSLKRVDSEEYLDVDWQAHRIADEDEGEADEVDFENEDFEDKFEDEDEDEGDYEDNLDDEDEDEE